MQPSSGWQGTGFHQLGVEVGAQHSHSACLPLGATARGSRLSLHYESSDGGRHAWPRSLPTWWIPHRLRCWSGLLGDRGVSPSGGRARMSRQWPLGSPLGDAAGNRSAPWRLHLAPVRQSRCPQGHWWCLQAFTIPDGQFALAARRPGTCCPPSPSHEPAYPAGPGIRPCLGISWQRLSSCPLFVISLLPYRGHFCAGRGVVARMPRWPCGGSSSPLVFVRPLTIVAAVVAEQRFGSSWLVKVWTPPRRRRIVGDGRAKPG